MPLKRQRPLPFQRTVIQRSTRSITATQDNTLALIPENSAPTLSKASTAILATSSPTPSPTPLPKRKKPLQNSWVFRHMPDENIQTIYYNESLRLKEWQC